MIYTITGNGKGKTTAALGLAIRAFGHNKKVLFISFCKGNKKGYFGELEFFWNELRRKCKDYIQVMHFGVYKIISKKNITIKDLSEANKALNFVEYHIKNEHYEIIIMDEIFNAINLGLIDLDYFIKVISKKNEETILVLTGRDAPQQIIDLSDVVSEIKCIKHHYANGVKAIKGFDY